MRILHVIRTLDLKDGGPPVVASKLAQAQASLPGRHSVAVLCHPSPTDGASHDANQEQSDVVRHVVSPGDLASWLENHLADFDVLHLHGVWDSILLKTAAKARSIGVPYAIVPHGMLDPWSLHGQGWLKSVKKRIAMAFTHRSLLNNALFIHVLNMDEGRLLAPLHLKPQAVVIPNGIFIDDVAPLPAAGTFRAAHPELGNDPYVLFLSRLHHKKGLDILADAFAQIVTSVPSVRLVVVGPDGGAEAQLRAQVQRLGLKDRVHLLGPLFGVDKLAALRDAHVFCLPSRQEGFSMAVTEAMACRCPVVISDQCHFPEVDEVKAGLVVPLGASQTAAALLTVLRMSQGDLQAMGARGQELVLSRYTWPAIAAHSISVYERLGCRR